ncbi:MAG TPA: GNAT family N-acetyltransferase [Gemmatimonadaceae bacterium]|jgi:ribosomal protein S18 acetylase RimI-like enzyme
MMIRKFTSDDYDDVVDLWRRSSGVTLRDVDAREPLLAYIARNPGLSFVATAPDAGRIVGAVLCGTDGRRGYLQHLAVDADYQRQGIGRGLAERCVAELAKQGIMKCHLMVIAGNDRAREFWTRIGWAARSDIQLMSHTVGDASA